MEDWAVTYSAALNRLLRDANGKGPVTGSTDVAGRTDD
jgi:hypothetical protein